MLVSVLNREGNPLMPCSPAKARLLLKEGKAKVSSRTPFQIQLLYGSSGHRQPVVLGVDSGFVHIGLSALSGNRELYVSQVQLRTDMVKLNSERRQYRRARRYRNTWYRQPRFDNRRKPESWLAPSIQNKLDTHIKVIGQVFSLLPISNVIVEVAAFDIQKIKNPSVSGTGYQNGALKDFGNVREYVLYRDGHKCVCCKGKSKDPVLEVHHLDTRQTAGNRPEIFVTLCRSCHLKVSQGRLNLEIRPSQGFKAETFMSTVRWKLINRLRLVYPYASISHTYGYITKSKRIKIELSKSHVNDAFIIAGGDSQKRTDAQYLYRQVRKCNRKLRKGDRSHIANTAPRVIHGFQRYDKVRLNGTECFIFGRRATGYFDLRTLDGAKIHASAKHSNCSLLERAATLLIQRITAIPPHPNSSRVQDAVSLPL